MSQALSPSLVKQAEFVRNVWSVSVPPNVAFDAVQQPEFWVHCTKTMKAGDRIECLAQDNRWFGELMVAKVGKHDVQVWTLNYVQLEARASAPPDPANYAVSLGGPQKWRVVRLSDKEVIHKGEPTEDAAKAWLAEFLTKGQS
jgi:hypothetical protein